jgi:hypothetical protein
LLLIKDKFVNNIHEFFIILIVFVVAIAQTYLPGFVIIHCIERIKLTHLRISNVIHHFSMSVPLNKQIHFISQLVDACNTLFLNEKYIFFIEMKNAETLSRW